MIKEKIVIFGDSYSTFGGYNPDGYAIYYPKYYEGSVQEVTQTWWHMLLKETSSELVLNDSWSGSTMCNTGYDGDCSATSSFIFRLNRLIDSGFFSKNNIDRVLVFGATNDSATGNECGNTKYKDWKEQDLALILPGISYFMDRLTSVVEKEKIHFILNTELRQEVHSGIVEICNYYGVSFTELENIEKVNAHPNQTGMIQIKKQIYDNIK